MTFKEFIKKYNGKAIDFDGAAGVQCVDLVDVYLRDVFNITGIWVGGARELYTQYERYPALVKCFERVPNTKDLVCKMGDIVVWGGGKWGHCAIADGVGNVDYFYSYEQNTLGKHEPTHRQLHFFGVRDTNKQCLGVLRARPQYQGKITGANFNVRIIDKRGMNIRKAADDKSQIVGLVPYGYIVQIYETELDGKIKWGHLADGRGWICIEPRYVAKID